MLPYDVEALRALVESYNRSLWPAQLLAVALAALVVYRGARPPRAGDRLPAVLLVIAWSWTGLAYLAGSYAALNWAGWLYAAVFALQALALLWRGVIRPWPASSATRPVWRPGLWLAGFTLIGSPLLDFVLGGGVAAARVVGLLPDATAVFSLGVLLASHGAPRWLLLAPLAWSGWSALWWWQLQAPAAALLPALGIVAVVLRLARRRSTR